MLSTKLIRFVARRNRLPFLYYCRNGQTAVMLRRIAFAEGKNNQNVCCEMRFKKKTPVVIVAKLITKVESVSQGFPTQRRLPSCSGAVLPAEADSRFEFNELLSYLWGVSRKNQIICPAYN
jgi:hypothetical protein